MARNRAGNATSSATPTITENRRVHNMAIALNQTEINTLLASSSTRGQYNSELEAYLNAGEAGVQISLTDGTFAGKKPQSVKTGFENAKKRLAEKGTDEQKATVANVRVILHEGNVFLIRQDMVGAESAAA